MDEKEIIELLDFGLNFESSSCGLGFCDIYLC